MLNPYLFGIAAVLNTAWIMLLPQLSLAADISPEISMAKLTEHTCVCIVHPVTLQVSRQPCRVFPKSTGSNQELVNHVIRCKDQSKVYRKIESSSVEIIPPSHERCTACNSPHKRVAASNIIRGNDGDQSPVK